MNNLFIINETFSNGYYVEILDLISFLSILCGALWSGISLLCLKLSNSGDFLKLLVPNYIRKNICGWINHSCKVISQMIIEREMEYRGSKSIIGLGKPANYKPVIVKEQRVDGSYTNLVLRCTLTGLERNYQVRIPSNQINKQRFYTTQIIQPETIKLYPLFLTGFTYGEGCFHLSIVKNNKLQIGWIVKAVFSRRLLRKLQKDLPFLNQIKSFFGIGSIYKQG